MVLTSSERRKGEVLIKGWFSKFHLVVCVVLVASSDQLRNPTRDLDHLFSDDRGGGFKRGVFPVRTLPF